MAELFRANDPRFQREVAIKMIPAEFLLDSQFRKRFEKEATVIARLEHPAIVPVYDFGDDYGRLFLVMRLMEGGSLQDKLDGNPVAVPETARLLNRAEAYTFCRYIGLRRRWTEIGIRLF